MKKILAILLALVVLCSFAACGKNNNENTTPSDDASVVDPAVSDSSEDVSNEEPEANTPAEGTPAQILLADFKERVAAGEADIEIMADEIIKNENVTFMGAVMPVEEGFLNGFTTEITGFAKAAQFGPMIGSIPFIGYIFELADDADVEAFKATLKDNADLRWNICTEAEEMVCESEGNLVFFVMAPSAFEE